MPDSYRDLLDATIDFLESQKARGEKWVAVSPATLGQLSEPSRGLAPKARAPLAVPVAQAILPPPVEFPASAPSGAESPVGLVAPLSKMEQVSQLRARVLACEKCPHLVWSRKSVVFGVGDIESPLLFVGEAPGADEDKQGEPFVGPAGQLLTRIIKAMNFTRETVFIANVLKCRPDTPGQSFGNRKPTAEEMRTCLPYLLEQIQAIKPKVIVALGATAMEGLFGKPTPISKARGHWLTFQNTPVMPTYHPSYLLRNQTLSVKREVWEDMLQVLERLGAAITEKQRNYFKE